MIYLAYLIAGAVIFAVGSLMGAYLYYRAEKHESPGILKFPAKPHKVRAPRRDEDIDDT